MATPEMTDLELKRVKQRDYMRKYRATNPEKAKAQAAEWYQANKERINEPKRRANFEANERDRERKCLAKGTPFTPRDYVSYTTNDSRIPAREIAKQRDRTMFSSNETD